MKKLLLISLLFIGCKKENPTIEQDKFKPITYVVNFTDTTDFAFTCSDYDNNQNDTIYNVKNFIYNATVKDQESTGNVWASACITRVAHHGIVTFTIMAIDNGDTVKKFHLPGEYCYGFN